MRSNSVNEAKLIRPGLWASNCTTYSTGLDFKVCLRARTVSGPFEGQFNKTCTSVIYKYV